ncbi:MAG TPA: 50S ribosomal protein L3, partial [Halieaceae bacterium]|nr:50S ribosomal protein L3 [Halieaceae bacterium]
DGSDESFELGAELTVARFEQGQKVDVAGQSKGKGFQGGVKRWNFSMQDATHGNSLSHRA